MAAFSLLRSFASNVSLQKNAINRGISVLRPNTTNAMRK